MFILKILFASLSLILSLFVWLCAGLLSCSGFVFKLASGLLSLLAFAVLITYSVKNGIILLVLAFLISPMGMLSSIFMAETISLRPLPARLSKNWWRNLLTR